MARVGPTEEHLDPTAEISLEAVKARAVKGVAILTGRTFFLQVLSFIALILLGVFLEPEQFGVFIIVSAIINFLRYFSDIGLAAALIQKKEKVKEVDLKTTFTIQQALVLLVLTILVLLTPVFERVYSLSFDGKLLLYALGISFFMSSLKTIPSVLLERELDFSKFVIPELLENIVYQFSVVLLAWQGFGIRSFTYAVLARGLVGLVAIYIIRPWTPGFAISRNSLRKLLTFGIPYQLNTFLATLKDDGMTVFLGGILGVYGVGLLGWAQKWAQYPLRLFMDNVLKVTFPAFSRMQDKKVQLERSLTRSIFFVCFLVFPSIVGLLILAPFLIEMVPSYEKWRPAIIPLTLVSINVAFAAATTQLTNLLNAIGRIRTTFKLMIMWTVLTWAFIPALASRFEVNGAAAGYALVGSSSVVAIYIAHRYVKFSLIDGVIRPGIAALVMAAFMLFLRGLFPATFYGVFILGTLGVIIYALAAYLIVGHSIVSDAKKVAKNLISR